MMGRRGAGFLLPAVLATVALAPASPAAAQSAGGDLCLTEDPPAADAGQRRIAFGITPLVAGTALTPQPDPSGQSRKAAIAALRDLRPRGRTLVLRLNRMFWSDGTDGIRRYAKLVDRFAKRDFDSELQVRYHPGPGQEGDMRAWRKYVRAAARILGRRDAVTALSITNEANLALSPNTSDGAYDGVRQAIVSGVGAARRTLDRIGRHDVELGFSFAWRYLPNSDQAFWQEIGERASARFRKALDYVGVQLYPHLFWPPVALPGRTAGDEVAEALHLVRNCYMPQAGLGDRHDLWVTENGYATNLTGTEASQVAGIDTTLDAVHRYSRTLGVTDYRWFNLRDNDTDGADLFSAVGVLRDDYSRKPGFDALKQGIRAYGR